MGSSSSSESAPPPPVVPQSYPDTSEYIYQGCFSDRDDRALPVYLGDTNIDGNCAKQCHDRARANGSRYYGLQFNGQCWASNGEGQDIAFSRYGTALATDQWERDRNLTPKRCTKLDGGAWMNHVYKVELTNEEKNIHDNANTRPDNLSYPSYSGSRNYTYKGCWAEDGLQSLPNDRGAVSNAEECYRKAYANKNRYFGLRGGKCYTNSSNNTNDQTYKNRDIKGFTSKCQGLSGANGNLSTSGANQVYQVTTNQELNIHDNENTQADNTNYDKYTANPNYTYMGCWADDGAQTLPNDRGSLTSSLEQRPDECYKLAYKNKAKYFGLQSGKCFTSTSENDGDENYKKSNIKGFTDKCQGWTKYSGDGPTGLTKGANHVYKLKFTWADEIRVYTSLQAILATVIQKDSTIKTTLDRVNTKNTNISTYLSRTLTSLTAADAYVETAKTNSNSAFNSSSLSLQNAETSRRLSQDLTQQTVASQISDSATKNANDSLTFVANAKTNLDNATTNFTAAKNTAELAITEADRILENISTANTTLTQAITAYNSFYLSTSYDPFILSPRIIGIINQIETYIGKQMNTRSSGAGTRTSTGGTNTGNFSEDENASSLASSLGLFTDIPQSIEKFFNTNTGTTNTGTTITNNASIASIINNQIIPNITTIQGYLIRAEDQTKRNSISKIISQSQTGASIALTNAGNIQASSKYELLRLENLKKLEESQQSQLAAANAAEALKLQASYDEAAAEKARLNLIESVKRAEKAQTSYDRSLVQIETINKQNNLMNKMNENILSINDVVTIEGFTNPLPLNENREINNYVKSFNNNLALLDDPNQMTKIAFDTFLHIQDNKLEKLNDNLNNLKNRMSTSTDIPVKSIRSIDNSALLNVESYPDENTLNKDPKYLIYGNNGCLQYTTGYDNKPTTWDFKPCDANELEQQFKINQINTLEQYNAPIDNPSNESYKINKPQNANLGFYAVNPVNSYNDCLQLNNDGISVMPCTMDSEQRFNVNYHTVL